MGRIRVEALLLLLLAQAASGMKLGRPARVGGAGALQKPVMSGSLALELPQGQAPVAQQLSDGYRRISESHYVAVAAVQSCVLRGGSDMAGQFLRGDGLDLAHCVAMATVGLLFSGVVGSTWLRSLDDLFGTCTSRKSVVQKTVADYVCYAPFANSAYLLFVPLLTAAFTHNLGADPLAPALHTWETSFASAMALEASMFAPYNLLQFRLIPAPLRPGAGAVMSASFTILLSAMC